MHRDPPSCPQCKAPFTSLLTFRKLDGSMSDYPVEESVCLLKRAIWFEAYLKVCHLSCATAICVHLEIYALLLEAFFRDTLSARRSLVLACEATA